MCICSNFFFCRCRIKSRLLALHIVGLPSILSDAGWAEGKKEVVYWWGKESPMSNLYAQSITEQAKYYHGALWNGKFWILNYCKQCIVGWLKIALLSYMVFRTCLGFSAMIFQNVSEKSLQSFNLIFGS